MLEINCENGGIDYLIKMTTLSIVSASRANNSFLVKAWWISVAANNTVAILLYGIAKQIATAMA